MTMTPMVHANQPLLHHKDPPSYYSLYMGESLPPGMMPAPVTTRSTRASKLRRHLRRQCAFLQRILAATFVAATISTTVMLLLWQLQNITDPAQHDPWLDPTLDIHTD
ncbi:hypothetical protein BC940DRAFT_368295 [Gongronella butleri]|nr:hypothetical protein BC940DRAFT_368295 [Gongronella butleri]